MNRPIIATLISFFIVIIICPKLIPVLASLKFGQPVRGLGPKTHYKKAGTPTMGGISFLVAIIVTCILFSGGTDFTLLFAVLLTVIFSLIGFLDDYVKIAQKNAVVYEQGISSASLGLGMGHKIILQIVVSAALAIYTAYHPDLGTDIIIPFFNVNFDLGIFFIPFVIFAVVGILNAVNFTDGLDGLASGVTMIVMTFFLFACISDGYTSMSIFGASVIGGCLGFLCYNFNPAGVFMGDTGSMALGGAVSVIAVLSKTELFVVIAGLIYVIEALSVVLQIGYFRLTHGKRLFKMAPIHHHFELIGYEETKIVISFWVFTAVCVMIAMLSLNITF
ncbi:MAG: phospho-N-acetylmuramoyl-pentapeptide-transferase [Anaerofustis stercorihominis]|nr:phospho-N-acetylmuramoyl-pentapeptide-transferase [Anaerofustis stercorihominis]